MIRDNGIQGSSPTRTEHSDSSSKQPSKCNFNWTHIEKELNALVGLEDVKRQIQDIAKILGNLQERNKRLGLAHQPTFHVLIEGEQGTGKTVLAHLLSKILFLYGFVKLPSMLEADGRSLESWRPITNLLQNQTLTRAVSIEDIQNIMPQLTGDGKYRNTGQLETVWKDLLRYKEQHCFIIGIKQGYASRFMQAINGEQVVQFHLKLPSYSNQELLAFARKYAAKQRYKLSKAAVEHFLALVDHQRKSPDFKYLKSVKNIVDRAILHCLLAFNIDEIEGKKFTPLEPDHFPRIPWVEPQDETEPDPLEELDSLIGLDTVKARVRDIMAYLALRVERKKLGLDSKPLCVHMAFTGNPGTGKTSVARLIGRIFRKIQLLDQGHFIEAAREDLVAGFVGQTALKTARLIQKAQGGVLYVDEAYSLNGGSDRDYGNEAIAVLVKKMEDARDKFAVIFSGYQEEMEGFLDLNPGLRERIQIHIHFPDYTPDEMVQIFEHFCSKENYRLSQQARAELPKMFGTIYDNRDKNFANGRLVRKLFERAKLALARRMWSEPEERNVSELDMEDILALYECEDLQQVLWGSGKSRRRIGFAV